MSLVVCWGSNKNKNKSTSSQNFFFQINTNAELVISPGRCYLHARVSCYAVGLLVIAVYIKPTKHYADRC